MFKFRFGSKKKLHFRSLPIKWVAVLLVLLTTGSLLFNKQITGFLGQRINPFSIENQTETVLGTPQPQAENADNKSIKSICVDEAKKYIETNNLLDESFTQKINSFKTEARKHGWSDSQIQAFIDQKIEEFVWQVNSKYRICLAEKGLTPEDLLSAQNLTNGGINEGATSTQNTVKNLFEEAERDELERKQKCQQDLAKYSACLAEYNAKVSEYNLCKSDPRKSNILCGFEPYNSCFKPFCL